jgi:flagellar protein FliL
MATSTAKLKSAGESAEQPAKKGKKKLIMILLPVLLLGLGGGGYFMFFKKSDKPEPPPVKGVVVTMEAITINLAGGHYLKLGLALQATATAHEEPDGSQALDLAITMFSNRTVAELSAVKTRAHLKEELVGQVEKAYKVEGEKHGSVMGLYFTQFVMQ